MDNKVETLEQTDKTIQLTPELVKIFEDIKRDSKLSNRELAGIYMEIPEYKKIVENIMLKTVQVEEQVKKVRESNLDLDDDSFFNEFLSKYTGNLIDMIKSNYGETLTPEIIERLDNFNIEVFSDPEQHGDMTAHPDDYQVSINMAHFAKDKQDVEGKIVKAMGTMPHELFHFIYRTLKDKDECDERMVYNLSNGDTASCLGMAGHMLNEGFVEKLSSEFCEKNNIYYSISPSYIQFANLCDYIMKTDVDINEEFLIDNNYEDILERFTSDAKEAYNECERYEYLGRFELKTKSGEKRKISIDEVIDSYNEKIELELIEKPNSR